MKFQSSLKLHGTGITRSVESNNMEKMMKKKSLKLKVSLYTTIPWLPFLYETRVATEVPYIALHLYWKTFL